MLKMMMFWFGFKSCSVQSCFGSDYGLGSGRVWFGQPRVSVLVRVCFGFMFGSDVESAGRISGRPTTVNGLGSGQIMKWFS
ncbi:hypothetical protein HanRHA438_Chr16g0751021 [Helianthus annuus]|nr:hypothetical protein HanRHA438_Chr16g0751021 [Helianthus annuus]